MMRVANFCAFFLSCITFSVQAVSLCSVSATNTTFNNYVPYTTTPDDITSTISVTCTGLGTATYTITLNAGLTGSFNSRIMTGGAQSLNYNLYTSNSYNVSAIWGDGSNGTAVISDSGSLTVLNPSFTKNYTVYGRIPTLQNETSGSFSDTITATLTYTIV